MSGLTIEQRFQLIEDSLNKLMELVLEAPSMDEASGFANLTDEELDEMHGQVLALERTTSQLANQIKLLQNS
jgi:hypothetical protein